MANPKTVYKQIPEPLYAEVLVYLESHAQMHEAAGARRLLDRLQAETVTLTKFKFG